MRVINQDEFNLTKNEIKGMILDGKVFTHPTDTIYGISCDATNSEAVAKVRKMKQRSTMPFSVIVPSLDWIKANLYTNEKSVEIMEKLPGPYTIVLKIKNKDCIASEINDGIDTLGVRIPDHWFTSLATEMGIPLLTTSANIVGEAHMTSLEDLDLSIQSKINFVVYEGEKRGAPSKVIDCSRTDEIITLRV